MLISKRSVSDNRIRYASEYLELIQCSVLKIPLTVTYIGKFAFDCGELSACLNPGGSELHTDELAWMY